MGEAKNPSITDENVVFRGTSGRVALSMPTYNYIRRREEEEGKKEEEEEEEEKSE